MIYKVYEQINKMEGKLTAKHYSDIILGIVKQWKQWGAYSSDFLCGLEYALSYNDGFDGSAIVASTRINKIKEIAGDYSTEGKNYHKKYGVYESNNPDSNFNRLIYVCNQILSKDKAQNTDISKVKNQLAKIQQRVSSIDDNNPDGDFITLEDVDLFEISEKLITEDIDGEELTADEIKQYIGNSKSMTLEVDA